MTDHRWLTLARTIGSWPDSLAGYVVTKNDKIIIGCGSAMEAAKHWDDASLYFVPKADVIRVDTDGFDGLARLIIPRGLEVYGVDLNVEIEEIEL